VATYVLYAKEGKETCGFEVWRPADPDDEASRGMMGECGKPAIGQRGVTKAGTALCEEHFYYCAKLDGVGKRWIETEAE